MAFSIQTWRRLAVDIVLLVIVVVFVALSHFEIIPPRKSGFFCKDESIKYPYTGDTISVRWLVIVNLAIPLLTAILVETWPRNDATCPSLSSNSLKSSLRAIGRVMLDLIIGQLFTLFLLEIMKTAVGEMRPHFLSTCQPDVLSSGCSDGYITNFTCTSHFPKKFISDSYKSFPSAHAGSAFFTSIFVILYLQIKGRWSQYRLLCSWLQMMSLSWALFCSVSRIADHRHHWLDVFIGGIIGSVFAIATVGSISDWFRVKTDVVVSLDEETSAQPDKRTSTRRLISTSSEIKDTEMPTVKTLDANHV